MIRSLQSLRFVFIMLVVMSHIIGRSFDFGGECGVSFFFVLSGFLLSYAYGPRVRQGCFLRGRFLARQLLKFYPLHLLTFLAMVALDARLGTVYSWPKLVANVLLLQSWVPSDDFFFVANGSSWFLSDLMFFYAVFSVLFLWLTTAPVRRLLGVGAVVLAGYVALAVAIPSDRVNAVLYASPVTRLLDFSLGILVCRVYASAAADGVGRWLSALPAARVSALEAVLVLWVAGAFFVYEWSAPGFRCAALFWLVSPVVLLGFVLTDPLGGVVTRVLHHRAMLFLGSISFEIYLTHWLTLRVLYSVMQTGGLGEPYRLQLPCVAVSVVAILVVAFAAKRLFVDRVFAAFVKYVE